MAAPETLVARQGDTIDALVWRERGLDAADLAPVLVLNPGLADRGPILPHGTVVIIPAATVPALPMRNTVNLWD